MKKMGVFSFAIFLLLIGNMGTFAAVTGECVNCHTMHNSQNGTDVFEDGESENLLSTDCIGCHSNADNQTIKPIGSSRVPIVYNLTTPEKPLAGGNFFWVAGGGDGDDYGDNFGHNVFGIAGQDGTLSSAPGSILGAYNQTDCGSCHRALERGCQSCHLPRHHAAGGVSEVADGGDGWYRFLGSAMYAVIDLDRVAATPGVIGIEEVDWEQNPSEAVHNVYKGTAAPYGDLDSYDPVDNSIGSFCAGCHSNFHTEMRPGGPILAWVRHPSDVVLPADADLEYIGYETYNPLAPVAKQSLAGGVNSSIDHGEDVVTCLSCHRAHGSAYSDMLRWDYQAECVVGSGTNTCGCFVCHTSKDGID